MSLTMKCWEKVIEYNLYKLRLRIQNKNIGESILFYARMIYHGSYFLILTILYYIILYFSTDHFLN